MTIVENIIQNIDENDIKDMLKQSLSQYNVVLNEKCLNEMLTFIDESKIEISNNYSFLKNPNKKDEYIITSLIGIYQESTKCPISSALQSKLRDIRTKGCYRIHPLENRIKRYWISLKHAYSFFCDKIIGYPLGTVTFDEVKEYVNECKDGCYDLIYDTDENGKKIRKILYTKDMVSIYKIDFGEHGIYIGQSKKVKTRMGGHRGQVSKGKHCYILNQLYKNDRKAFIEALNNVQILDTPNYLDYVRHGNAITNLEYSYQIEALRNNEKLLGKQCWDEDFRSYLAHNVDEYEYQELLAKSYQINNDPNNPNGYSTYNPCAKRLQNKQMSYEDVVRYFETLRQERESS